MNESLLRGNGAGGAGGAEGAVNANNASANANAITRLQPLTPEHYPALYPIAVREEIAGQHLSPADFASMYSAREGWTLTKNGKVIGAITLSNFRPLHSVILHTMVDSAHHSRWANRTLLRQAFGYVFGDNGLGLRKLYAYAIMGRTYKAAKMLTALGFRVIGLDTCGGVALDGAFYDVINYEMMREDCRWMPR